MKKFTKNEIKKLKKKFDECNDWQKEYYFGFKKWDSVLRSMRGMKQI